MKVLFYIHSLNVGGAETIVANYAIAMKNKGIDMVFVVNEMTETVLQKSVIVNGIKIYNLFQPINVGLSGRIKRYITKPFLSLKWKEILKAENPDIVHIHTVTNDYVPEFPLDKTVYTFHSNVERAIRLCGEANRRNIVKLADGGMSFIAINQQMVGDIRTSFKTEKITYIPNGIDLRKIYSAKTAKTDVLASIGAPEDSFVVGHVGRFDEVKNHERLIDIFEEIHNRNNKAILLLVGGGHEGRIEKIKQIVGQKQLTDNVYFLGIRQDVHSIESCMDVFVLPSKSESFSLSLIEAQVFGVRCIASDNVPKEVVCNNNCFRLSLDESNATWAEVAVSNSKSEYENELDQFDISTVVDKTIDLYGRLSGRN